MKMLNDKIRQWDIYHLDQILILKKFNLLIYQNYKAWNQNRIIISLNILVNFIILKKKKNLQLNQYKKNICHNYMIITDNLLINKHNYYLLKSDLEKLVHIFHI